MDQELLVTDRTDGKKYPAKVLRVDNVKNKVKIHFVGWKANYDEFLPFDSDRIHHDLEEEAEESFCSTQEVGTVGAAIGRLLVSVDTDSKKVVSTYDIRLSYQNNCNKNLNGNFKVPQLECCAAALKIKTKDEDGKKLFNKVGLTEAIVLKIKSHLPLSCRNCKEEYSLSLDESPLFQCHKCKAPSHNCEDIENIRRVFPEDLPRGFVWMCVECVEIDLERPSPTNINTDDPPNEETEKTSVSDTRSNVRNEVSAAKEDGKSKLCKYYAQRKCRHGPKGKGCSFAHPQKCFRFMRSGSHKKRGCDHGKDCEYYHPPLCKTSIKSGICSKQECNFHHIKGTKFVSNSVTEENAYVSNRSEKKVSSEVPIRILQRPSYADVAGSNRLSNDNPSSESAFLQRENGNANFLQLNHQIQQMQLQIEKILKMNLTQLTETKVCRCQGICH